MPQDISGYDVGALLYCPANAHHTVAQAVAAERLPRPFSLALCLEDTVRADALAAAEQAVEQTLHDLTDAARQETFYRPLTFVRVRSPEQLARLGRAYGKYRPLLTGFILPKFFIETCGAYCAVIRDLQADGLDYFYMPVFEAPSMLPLHTRHAALAEVKAQLDALRECILNIRVGGNDLCHVFGLRRDPGHTIYDLRPVADVLTDLLTTFAPDYLVAGPVWEYYDGPGWAEGLAQECALDRQDGHPSQADPHREPIPSGLPRRLCGREQHPRLGRPLSRGPQHRGHADERVSDPLPLGAEDRGVGPAVRHHGVRRSRMIKLVVPQGAGVRWYTTDSVR